MTFVVRSRPAGRDLLFNVISLILSLMKRITLIETAILVTALICGYQAFDSFMRTLASAWYVIAGGDFAYFTLNYLVQTAVYVALFYVLIRRGRMIAAYINHQWQPHDDNSAGFVDIKLHRHNLLFVVLISLALITIVQEIPPAAAGVINYYRRQAGGFAEWDQVGMDVNFKMAALRLLVSVLLLFYARPISNWFAKQPGDETVVLETEKSSEDVHQ